MNREAWLTQVADLCLPLFKGFKVGKFRVTCGWPCSKALSSTRRAIGECHGPKSSSDGTSELFISPLLAEPVKVAGVIVHEMAHVATGVAAAHGAGFVKVCRHVGLTKGKPTSAMPGEKLEDKLRELTSKVGAYPHAAMNPVVNRVKKASSVTVLVCQCQCRITMSNKMLAEHGAPTCSCGGQFEEV